MKLLLHDLTAGPSAHRAHPRQTPPDFCPATRARRLGTPDYEWKVRGGIRGSPRCEYGARGPSMVLTKHSARASARARCLNLERQICFCPLAHAIGREATPRNGEIMPLQ
jgi:hypothetical protein